jgi:hypothetical protein
MRNPRKVIFAVAGAVLLLAGVSSAQSVAGFRVDVYVSLPEPGALAFEGRVVRGTGVRDETPSVVRWVASRGSPVTDYAWCHLPSFQGRFLPLTIRVHRSGPMHSRVETLRHLLPSED